MSDQEIIQLIKNGKVHPAIKRIYKYFPVVRKYIVANSGTKHEAEDVFQDALVILMKKLNDETFELSSALNTYIFSVCRFIWLEQLRAKQKQVNASALLSFEYYQTEQLENDVKSDHALKKAQRAVENLGEKCREILMLFYYHKQSMKQIAEKLKFASEKGAKNQKYRCLEKAKEHFMSNN